MPAGLMVRNRLENKFIGQDAFLRLSREGLAASGLAVAEVTARAPWSLCPGPSRA